MIDPAAYGTDFYTSSAALPVRAGAAKTAAEEKEAADFARILNDTKTAAAPTATDATSNAGGVMGFIKGLIDVVNPLQHIPVVGAIYRHMTGDEISPAARLAGDTLYGGFIGAGVAVADIVAEKTTGRDIGENMIAAMTPDNTARNATALAQNDARASGTLRASDIVWSTAESSVVALNTNLDTRSLRAPLPPTATNGTDPAPSTPTPTAPGPTKEADSTPVLLQQEAPAAYSRTEVPPGLIAQRMAEALDKYTALQQSAAAPKLSAAY